MFLRNVSKNLSWSGKSKKVFPIVLIIALLIPLSHADELTLNATETQASLTFEWIDIPDRYPGIKHAHLTLTEPRNLNIHILRVDTSNPDIRFSTTGRHPNWGQQMSAPFLSTFSQDYFIRTGRQRTLNFLNQKRNEGLNMVAAINAAPWLPWTDLSVFSRESYDYADQLGLTIADGVLVDFLSNRPTFIVEKDWTVRVARVGEDEDISNILHAVSGFQFCLRNGNPQHQGTDLEPRTGFGVCRNNRYAFFMTIDGRQGSFSEGTTIREVGEFLSFFGAWTGINMDGGGSTTMALLNPETGNTTVVNSVSGSSPRHVGNNWGIYYVNPQDPELISFEDWLGFRRVDSADWDPQADSSGDGVPNLFAYLFNIHPLEGLHPEDSHAMPQMEMIDDESETRYLGLRFRINRHVANAAIIPETSTSLILDSWDFPEDVIIDSIGTDPITSDNLYRARIPIGSDKRFLRLKGQLNSTEN